MSSGSKPATTIGAPCCRAIGSNSLQPVTTAAWPAARKPSIFVSGSAATISIAGGTYLCADRIEKFAGRSDNATAAVATAVVSKPVAKKTTSSVVSRARSTAWVTE